MNRENHLIQNIKNNQQLFNLNEHIVLDWSSEKKITNFFPDFKVKIFRIDNQKIWLHNKAYNAAFQVASSNYIFKVDADVLIDCAKFSKLHYWNYDLIIFYNNKNDPGNFLIKRELLEEINGFNEYMWQWGWQDHDIISRAISSSKNVKYLEVYECISKIDHDNSERNKVFASNLYRNPDHFYYSYMKATNDGNAFIASKNLWSHKNYLDYKIDENKIIINHNYNLKSLNLIFKLQYKWKICKSFSKVYKSNTSLIKIILAVFLFLTPKKVLSRYFSIQLFV
tara:strand:- start:320 stop:1165 length:846 start_codon:yes stop_codon:yes gene_type:complete